MPSRQRRQRRGRRKNDHEPRGAIGPPPCQGGKRACERGVGFKKHKPPRSPSAHDPLIRGSAVSILIDKNTRVMTQGITGKTGQFHTQMSRAYANGRACFVAGVNPKKAGEDFEGIPIYGTVADAKKATGANVSVIYVPPPFAAAAIDEAVDADLDLVICITEGIPVRDMVRTKYRMIGKRTLLVGPNCPGVITPDEIKIGIMPGHIHKRGPIGVVSRSGTLTYEAVGQLTELGLGQSTSVGIGGDPVNGVKHIYVLRTFNDDPKTEAVIMVGEIGGAGEGKTARLGETNTKRTLVGLLARGTTP